MNRKDLEQLIIPGESVEEIKETHISLIILTEDHAYKIKKPVQYSFLDFSTLEKRGFFCEEEVRLNQRLCPEMYDRVIAIRSTMDGIILGGDSGELIDYAVKMGRIPEKYQMDLLLAKQQVRPTQIEQLALTLADFHRETLIIRDEEDINKRKENFNDILDLNRISLLHRRYLEEAVEVSDAFLSQYENAFKLRSLKELIRDCHGDLHAGNIFLVDRPLVFDCIEFKPAFRRIDILDELAFFCMDLEARGAVHFVCKFLKTYKNANPAPFTDAESDSLFLYYQLYRANVRAKVHSIRSHQVDGQKINSREMYKYLQLMHQYAHQLKKYFL